MKVYRINVKMEKCKNERKEQRELKTVRTAYIPVEV
jgi:hypothetical protein